MTIQLSLIDINIEARPNTSPDWQLDRVTLEIGRRGLAQARQALREAKAQPGDDFADAA